MQQARRFTGFILALVIPLVIHAPAFATSTNSGAGASKPATPPAVQQTPPPGSIAVQITVTAVVPSHRDIILDKKGNIVEIDSNTHEDVTPDAYVGAATPENKVALTADLYAQYRQLVPAGTDKYGVLYKRPAVQAIFSASRKPVTLPLFVASAPYRNS